MPRALIRLAMVNWFECDAGKWQLGPAAVNLWTWQNSRRGWIFKQDILLIIVELHVSPWLFCLVCVVWCFLSCCCYWLGSTQATNIHHVQSNAVRGSTDHHSTPEQASEPRGELVQGPHNGSGLVQIHACQYQLAACMMGAALAPHNSFDTTVMPRGCSHR